MTREQHLGAAQWAAAQIESRETGELWAAVAMVAAHHARAAQTCEECIRGVHVWQNGADVQELTCTECDGTGWVPMAETGADPVRCPALDRRGWQCRFAAGHDYRHMFDRPILNRIVDAIGRALARLWGER